MRRFLFLPFVMTLGASTLPAQQVSWVTQLLTAAQLPIVTLEARREGVPHVEIVGVLDAIRRAGLPAFEAVAVIDTARVVRRTHGPVDNFGAFVQSQLAQGKRGRELAAAIRTEHARSGRGPGTGAMPGARGRGDDAGRGNAGSPPGAQGRGKAAEPASGQRDRGRGNAADTARGRSDAQKGRPSDAGSKGKTGSGNYGQRPEDRGRGPAERSSHNR